MRALAVAGLIACLISHRAFACDEPLAVPTVPDGTTASRDEMLAAVKAFRAYDAEVREYAVCLEKSGGSELKQAAAVGKLQKFADKFNAELRVFKKKSGA
jgi:hypothetical protein